MRDGRLVGRGAADMKGELAARAVAIAAFARSGERPAGDVVLVAEADEERNTAGRRDVVAGRERPDLRCDFALNEGGGLLLELADGRRVVTVSVGEKQVDLAADPDLRRAPAHASVPAGADNPLRHAATAIERLLDHRPPARPVPSAPPRARRARAPRGRRRSEPISWAAEQHPVLADAAAGDDPDDDHPDRASRPSSRAT